MLKGMLGIGLAALVRAFPLPPSSLALCTPMSGRFSTNARVGVSSAASASESAPLHPQQQAHAADRRHARASSGISMTDPLAVGAFVVSLVASAAALVLGVVRPVQPVASSMTAWWPFHDSLLAALKKDITRTFTASKEQASQDTVATATGSKPVSGQRHLPRLQDSHRALKYRTDEKTVSSASKTDAQSQTAIAAPDHQQAQGLKVAEQEEQEKQDPASQKRSHWQTPSDLPVELDSKPPALQSARKYPHEAFHVPKWPSPKKQCAVMNPQQTQAFKFKAAEEGTSDIEQRGEGEEAEVELASKATLAVLLVSDSNPAAVHSGGDVQKNFPAWLSPGASCAKIGMCTRQSHSLTCHHPQFR